MTSRPAGHRLSVPRRIAELEGWPNVTVRRLSDEKFHTANPSCTLIFEAAKDSRRRCYRRFPREIGLKALEKARKRVKRGEIWSNPVAAAYLEFAASSPALYEVMFSLSLSVPFDDAATPPELRFAFPNSWSCFRGRARSQRFYAELFWASLRRIAGLTRTKRFPRSRQKERVRALVELFSPKMKRHRW